MSVRTCEDCGCELTRLRYDTGWKCPECGILTAFGAWSTAAKRRQSKNIYRDQGIRSLAKKGRSFAELGRKFGLSRERIRQIVRRVS